MSFDLSTSCSVHPPHVCFADLFSCTAGGRFVFSHCPGSWSILDSELVSCIAPRGSLVEDNGVGIVLLNSCETLGVCEQLQATHAVPMCIGWQAGAVSGQHCTAMVRLVELRLFFKVHLKSR